jgi:hypothetical protein
MLMKIRINRIMTRWPFKYSNFVIKDPNYNIKAEDSILALICGIVAGIFMISLIIWNRLIRERLPREITGEIHSLTFWVVLFFFVLSFITVLVLLYKLQKTLRGNPVTTSKFRINGS